MTRVDFYHLQQKNLEEVLPKLLQQAYGLNKRIKVKIGSEDKIEYLNCGNWVKYLSEKGKLENYVWIKNEDSTDYTEDIKFNFSSTPIIECNLGTIDTPDELFICLSPQWIPPHLRCLFYIIVDIFNSIYDTEFKIQGDEENNGKYI